MHISYCKSSFRKIVSRLNLGVLSTNCVIRYFSKARDFWNKQAKLILYPRHSILCTWFFYPVVKLTLSNLNGLLNVGIFFNLKTLYDVGDLSHLAAGNGFAPGRRQAIRCIDVDSLALWFLATNFNEIRIKVLIFSLTKTHLKMSAKWRPFCLDLSVSNKPATEASQSCVSQQNVSIYVKTWLCWGSGSSLV